MTMFFSSGREMWVLLSEWRSVAKMTPVKPFMTFPEVTDVRYYASPVAENLRLHTYVVTLISISASSCVSKLVL
jgi:hypothetical protein